ncbi:leucine-rich repeat receptor-like serine/threonine-protein kinase [Canna indica]|uniref:non-specific serine/threonine protein kinase n=1 Tax=Canna indica TaxID=4628 RepID=A0AAQ3KGU7_9LILI|nr:leucine-rich repeat receptor-like serine/threonine-protein kinase [Canna indica]
MAALLLLALILSQLDLVVTAANTTVDPIQGASRDRAALLSFASAISSDPGGALAGWGAPGSDACNWTGVTCHRVKHRVVQLILSGRGLRGVISPAVGNLSFLVVLDLSDNFFSGTIPPVIGYLSRLEQLSLSKNLLTGSIPVELGSLHQLIYLDLDSNQLSGPSPRTLFCNCTSLQYVDLSNNSLAGEVPLADECRLPDLRFLLLWSNNFEGSIPAALSNSSKLSWIDFESNHLSGVLPSGIFDKMPFLQFLYLSYNNLSSHDDNTNLTPFFASLRNCSHLQELELAGNNLGGSIPPLIGDLSINLVQLHLDENAISGPIPPNISNLVNLTYLNLSYNYLNGSIPPDLSRLRKLERVYLSHNLLSGEIPVSLGEIPHLGLLDISANRLTGFVPDTLSNLSQLRTLMLHQNWLSGTIPASLGNCVNLEILDLSHNRLTGRIPSDVAALGSLKLYLNLSSNLLEGPLPLELSKMDMILALDLSSNNLSGAIPPQLGSCVALEYLNLSGNNLQGPLPSSVGALPYLQVLDISSNRLSGAMPDSLRASVSLKQFNVSFNNFSGAIPTDGIFASLSADSFLGNEGLCGSIPGVSSCETKRTRRPTPLPILLAVVGTICTIFVLVCSIVRRSRPCARLPTFHRQGLIATVEGENPQHHPRISYRQLVEATGGFADSNLVGGGSFGNVYKGTLQDETPIAVKVLDPRCGVEISGSFKRECQVLKRTRHRNLIRVITACSKPDFKALVLPLMPNGSLEKFLYPPNDESSPGLELRQLVSILSDVAEGVAYLHHYAPFRVIHCDLKPSNILLDEDMTALVSDFGISKLMRGINEEESNNVHESSAFNSITGLLQGSVGYIAPEYGLGGQPSTQGDVYSFGVILLEMITGKRPTGVIFDEGLTLHDWVKGHYPHNVETITLQAPLKDHSSVLLAESSLYYKKLRRDVMVELIELGLVCTQLSPSMRPTMADVANEISILKQDLARHGGEVDAESCSTPNSPSF